MAEFPDFASELDFVERMVTEESVFCLPSKVGKAPHRIVTASPRSRLTRLRSLCSPWHLLYPRSHLPTPARTHSFESRFFSLLYPSSGTGVYSASKINGYQKILLGVKRRRRVRLTI
jgi:hypothetical protein